MASAYQPISKLANAPNAISELSISAHAYLTARESRILAEIVEGLSSKEIARALDLSPRTIEFHRANLLRKWGAKNTAHLVRKVLGD